MVNVLPLVVCKVAPQEDSIGQLTSRALQGIHETLSLSQLACPDLTCAFAAQPMWWAACLAGDSPAPAPAPMVDLGSGLSAAPTPGGSPGNPQGTGGSLLWSKPRDVPICCNEGGQMAALRALLQSTLAVTETGLCVLPASAALSLMSLLSIKWWLCCGPVGLRS